MEEECPKCHETGLRPVYHRSSKQCVDPPCINIGNGEHLHYKCGCGYDFVKSVKEGEDS
jgi:hypothetical protein